MSSTEVDQGGLTYIVKDIKIGATGPGQEGSATSLSSTELGFLDGITAGTVIASKAVVVNSSKELTWAMTDSGVGTVTPLNFTLTATGVGASVDGAKFTAVTEAALGTYANALNAKLDFGTTGHATGLGGAFCAELDLGPGTTSGSYAVFEGELNVPTSGSLGTRTSFFSLNAWGANVAAFDTGGFLFDVNGVTANTGKFYRAGLSQAVTATARLRCQVAGVTYYIPLCVNEALTS